MAEVQMADVLGNIGRSEEIRNAIIRNRLAEIELEKQQDLWRTLQQYSGVTPGITPITTPAGPVLPNRAPPVVTPGIEPITPTRVAPQAIRGVPTTDPENDPRTVALGADTTPPANAPPQPNSFEDRWRGDTAPAPLPGTVQGGVGPTVAPPQAAGLMRHPQVMAQMVQTRAAMNATEKAEFDFKVEQMGQEARGVLPFVDTPQFPQVWNDAITRLRNKGVIDDNRYRLWYNNPSPLALQQALALSSSMDAYLKLEGIRTSSQAASALSDIAAGRRPTTPPLAPPPAIARPYSSVPPVVNDAINKAAAATGVPADYLRDRSFRESSFDPNSKSKTSSAEGLFQFIDQTWLEQLKNNGAKYGMSDLANAIEKKGSNWVITEPQMEAKIMAARRDPYVNALMGAEFTKSNAEYLKNAGLPPTPGNLHLAHFLGPKGAMEFITAMQEDPSQAATKVVSRDAYRDNPDVFIEPNTNRPRTLDEVYRRVSTPASGRAPGEPLRVGQAPGSATGGPAVGTAAQPPAPGASAPASAQAFSGLAPSLQGNSPGYGPGGVPIQDMVPALIQLSASPNLSPGLQETVKTMLKSALDEQAATPAMKEYNQYANYERSMGRTPLGPMEKQVELERERGRAAALEHGAGQGNKPGLAKAQTDIAELYGTYQKMAIDAGRKSQIYDEMEQALQGFDPGATADVRNKAKAIFSDITGLPTDGVADWQYFLGLQRRMELLQTPKGQGQITENERVLIRDTIASTNLTREALVKLLGMMRKLDSYDAKIAEALRDNAKEYGGAPDPVSGYEAIQKIAPPLDKGDLNFLSTLRKQKPDETQGGQYKRGETEWTNPATGETFVYQGGDRFDGKNWKKK